MQTLIADLITTLRHEIASYRTLLLLVRGVRARIVKGDLRAVREMTQKKEAITQDLQRLATCRAAILDQLAPLCGEERAGLTLARLAGKAPPEAGEALRGLLAEFRGIVGQLLAANEVNQTLLTRSLDTVRGTLELFRTVVTQSPTYEASGRLGESVGVVLALNQTV